MRRAVIACALGCGLVVAAATPGGVARADVGQLPLPRTVSLADAPAMGDPAARVVVIEFSDFHCPFCRQHAREALPQIKKAYVETGQVLYVFRHFPLDTHPRAPDAAVAAMCAARQGKFWQIHDRFFAAPRPVQPADLEGHARAVGVNLPPFRTCLKGIARTDVQTDAEEARHLGMMATPSFLLGHNDGDNRMRPAGRMAGAQPFEAFKTAIDGLLGK